MIKLDYSFDTLIVVYYTIVMNVTMLSFNVFELSLLEVLNDYGETKAYYNSLIIQTIQDL